MQDDIDHPLAEFLRVRGQPIGEHDAKKVAAGELQIQISAYKRTIARRKRTKDTDARARKLQALSTELEHVQCVSFSSVLYICTNL